MSTSSMIATDYKGSTTATQQAEYAQLREWLAKLAMDNKATMLFELEVWVRCFDRFFRIRNHPFSETELREIVRRDFSEEVKIVRSVSLRMSQLCTDIISLDRTDSAYFGSFIESEILQTDVTWSYQHKPFKAGSPEDSLSLLVESLADLRPILESLIQAPHINFQTFTSIGKLISRELQRSHFLTPLLANKFKPEFDRIEHSEITAIIKSISAPELRQELAQVFLEVFRLLRYLHFIGEDLREDRPLKRSLLIFSLIYSEIRALLEFIDSRILTANALDEEKRDMIDGSSYALRMELNKVFGKELVGFVNLRQAPPIYAKVENSHGLLRNCLQQTIVSIAQAFNPRLTGAEIFPDYQTFREQSKQLRADLWHLIMHLRYYEAHVEQAHDGDLIDELVIFRDGSMRFLMFRDWEQLERLYDEIVAATTPDTLRRTIHLFATYLETLLGQINLRAVLAEDPFDYPEVKIKAKAA
ncbi:MAG TPA: hypothetical protein VFZ34_04400 [Blastocatellia bacterium]|nr:hypothetical protein [Blastocatellia bacterium]